MHREAEAKSIERKMRNIELKNIQLRINLLKRENILLREEKVFNKEFQTYDIAINNLNYGFSNRELKDLADAYDL